jgi:uncharacterized repeat protein (TIGR03803 family)
MRNTIVLFCCGAILAGCAQRAGTLVPAQRSPASESVASAKSYKVIYDFDKDRGQYPNDLIDVGGTLYGTTSGGGSNGRGTVFTLTAAGKGRVIYSFKGGDDGAEPSARLTNVNGTLYGTTGSGGGMDCTSRGCGTVFKVTTAGKESVLYRFTGPPGDGDGPSSALLAVGNTLYGTTYYGGASNSGTIYTLKTTGSKAELYDFTGGDDGSNPSGGLTLSGGVLYGTTFNGGTRGFGTVFTVTPSGKETVLHSFLGSAGDGQGPNTDLLDVKGTLYGTTIYGGNSYFGTVFSITQSGTETPIFNFAGYVDGGYPKGSLVDVNGALYGTTQEGGETTNYGVVYKLTTAGTLTFLHSFKGPPKDGAEAGYLLTSLGGKLYGTTFSGGKSNKGTVYELAP